jgi:hypothetical protein
MIRNFLACLKEYDKFSLELSPEQGKIRDLEKLLT